MHKPYWLFLVLIFLPGLTQAQVVGTCEADLPVINKERCSDPFYYVAYRDLVDQAINKVTDEKTTAISQDNHSNVNNTTDETVKNLASFLQCQVDACNAYFEGCTTNSTDSRLFSETASQCQEEAEVRYTLQKAISKNVAQKRAQRMARTTFFEQQKAIQDRIQNILMPIADKAREHVASLKKRMSFLVQEMPEVDT